MSEYEITLKDFKQIYLEEDSPIFYHSYKFQKYELCIELGFGCYDVAIYEDDSKFLLEPKKTINRSKELHRFDHIGLIIKEVNRLYEKYSKLQYE